jgi:hypothetical protein
VAPLASANLWTLSCSILKTFLSGYTYGQGNPLLSSISGSGCLEASSCSTRALSFSTSTLLQRVPANLLYPFYLSCTLLQRISAICSTHSIYNQRRKKPDRQYPHTASLWPSVLVQVTLTSLFTLGPEAEPHGIHEHFEVALDQGHPDIRTTRAPGA